MNWRPCLVFQGRMRLPRQRKRKAPVVLSWHTLVSLLCFYYYKYLPTVFTHQHQHQLPHPKPKSMDNRSLNLTLFSFLFLLFFCLATSTTVTPTSSHVALQGNIHRLRSSVVNIWGWNMRACCRCFLLGYRLWARNMSSLQQLTAWIWLPLQTWMEKDWDRSFHLPHLSCS